MKPPQESRELKSRTSKPVKPSVPAPPAPTPEAEPAPPKKIERAPKRLSEIRNSRKKSSVGLLVAMLGAATFVAILGYLVAQYMPDGSAGPSNTVAANSNESTSEKPAESDPKTSDLEPVTIDDDPTLPQSKPFPVFEEENLPAETVKPSKPEPELEPIPETPMKNGTGNSGIEESPEFAAGNPLGSEPKDPPINETPAVEVDPIVAVPTEEPSPPTDIPLVQDPEKQISFDELKALPLAQQYELKNHLLVVKNLWRQQLFDEVPEVVAQVQQGPHGEELGEAILATNEKLRGFWKHFALSCQQYPERQIEIGDRVVGLVERLPDSIILRISGTNRNYEHRFVPPGIMMAIADRVAEAAEDNEYELKKAAFYISKLSERPNYSDRVDETLNEYENAQIDVAGLRLMTNLKFWDLGETVAESEQVKFRADRELSDGLKEAFGAENPKKTKPPEAFDLMQTILKAAANPSDGSHFGMEDTSDPQEMRKRRMVMLEAARAYGARSGYTPLVVDIVNELSAISSADKDEVLFDSLIELSRTAGLAPENANLFCDEVLQVARGSSAYSSRDMQRLIEAAIKVAEKQNLRTFGVQLVNKLESLANGN